MIFGKNKDKGLILDHGKLKVVTIGEDGIAVDKRKVVLERDIKEFGTYKAEVKLYTGISASIDVQVSEA